MSQRMPKIAVVDYGLGNLYSMAQALQRLGASVLVTADQSEIRKSDAIVLPGVGAFGQAMDNLKVAGLDEELRKLVLSGRPFLGVCLGLQLLFDESAEHGAHKGLGILKGQVKRFPAVNARQEVVRVPNIGWSEITAADNWSKSPLRALGGTRYFYFVHSYFVCPSEQAVISSMSSFGGVEFCSSVHFENIFATQFHPEKSGPEGLKVLQKWLDGIGNSVEGSVQNG